MATKKKLDINCVCVVGQKRRKSLVSREFDSDTLVNTTFTGMYTTHFSVCLRFALRLEERERLGCFWVVGMGIRIWVRVMVL